MQCLGFKVAFWGSKISARDLASRLQVLGRRVMVYGLRLYKLQVRDFRLWGQGFSGLTTMTWIIGENSAVGFTYIPPIHLQAGLT